MDDIREPITCFDDEECNYDGCPLFNVKLDKCKLWKLKTLLDSTAEAKTPIRETVPQSKEVKEVNPLYDYPPSRQDLEAKLGDVFDSDLEYCSDGTVKTRRFLDDKWGEINEVLASMGYSWHSDKESKVYEWRYGEKKPIVKKKDKKDETIFANLKQDSFAPKLKGKIVDDPVQRDIDTSYGPKTLANFRLNDGTANIRVTLWGDLAEEIMDHVKGDEITLTNMSVRDHYKGTLQVSSTRPNPEKKFKGTQLFS